MAESERGVTRGMKIELGTVFFVIVFGFCLMAIQCCSSGDSYVDQTQKRTTYIQRQAACIKFCGGVDNLYRWSDFGGSHCTCKDGEFYEGEIAPPGKLR